MAKPDEIMAEQLLKGGKMLAKSCKNCGNPLFEVKGETTCVVCASGPVQTEVHPEPVASTPSPDQGNRTVVPDTLAKAIGGAVTVLCERAARDTNPANSLLLMQAVECGVRALQVLRE